MTTILITVTSALLIAAITGLFYLSANHYAVFDKFQSKLTYFNFAVFLSWFSFNLGYNSSLTNVSDITDDPIILNLINSVDLNSIFELGPILYLSVSSGILVLASYIGHSINRNKNQNIK